MQAREQKVLNIIDLSFCYRYVDNILAIFAKEITDILEKFNSYYNFLKFIIEIEENCNLSFLNLLLKINDNKIYVNWFYKKTFSGRVLSFYFNHPKYHKLGIIYALVNIIELYYNFIPVSIKEYRIMH